MIKSVKNLCGFLKSTEWPNTTIQYFFGTKKLYNLRARCFQALLIIIQRYRHCVSVIIKWRKYMFETRTYSRTDRVRFTYAAMAAAAAISGYLTPTYLFCWAYVRAFGQSDSCRICTKLSSGVGASGCVPLSSLARSRARLTVLTSADRFWSCVRTIHFMGQN